jgi:hypothetical protein
MSWKIYVAWRVPVERLNEALDAIREEMTKHFYEVWKMYADNLLEKNPDMNPLERAYRVHKLFNTFTYDIHQPMACGAAIRLDGEGYAYFEPYGPFRIAEKMEVPDWFEDFCYWNNTDEPEDMDEDEWESRREKWEEMITYGSFTQQVSRLLDFMVYSPDSIPTQMAITDIYCRPYFKELSDESEDPSDGDDDEVSEG